MTFLQKKQITIDLETLNINANYLVQVLKQVNVAKDEEITAELRASYKTLFEDTQRNLSSLRDAFIPAQPATASQKGA